MLFLNLPLANLSFLAFQQESNNLIPGAFIALSFKSFPPCSQQLALLPFFPRLPGFQAASAHTFCLRLITSLMETPLLATHRQINRSNNTPISSNYVLIRPGRTQLAAGRGCSSDGGTGCELKVMSAYTCTHAVMLLFSLQS